MKNERKFLVFFLATFFLLFFSFLSYSGTMENIGMGIKVFETEYPNDFTYMKNPAAVYCHEILGYEYKTIEEPNGQRGICIMPDSSECPSWQFFAGRCGDEFSFCAVNGYDTITKTDGKNPFNHEYAFCLSSNGKEIGSATDLSNMVEIIADCTGGV
ncbi:MAG: DUF333 domain-containing protein [Nanoarchaeota archaeon]